MPAQLGHASPPGHTPAVSIVLATNRDSPYLEETLRSVRGQSFTDWELLVVDNGIPDNGQVADLIADDRRMSMIKIDDSATAGIARNVGVGLTGGRYVTYLDDDDVWAPDRLEKHLQAHAQHPEAPATFSGYWHMDSEGRHFGVDWRAKHTGSADILRGRADTPLGPTVMVRREDYRAIGGFSPEIPILVDFEFALRLALRGDLVYIDELLVGYRRHSANMTSTAPDNARRRRRTMEEMIDRQRWAALGRGDVETASLFEERLRRYRKSEARAAGPAVLRLVRRRRFRDAVEQSIWGVTRVPLTFASALGSAPIGKVRRGIQSRRKSSREDLSA